jgi:hypothetical protein
MPGVIKQIAVPKNGGIILNLAKLDPSWTETSELLINSAKFYGIAAPSCNSWTCAGDSLNRIFKKQFG